MPDLSSAPRATAFHAHLDECSQCGLHPFDLCDMGDALAQAAYEETAAKIHEELKPLTDPIRRSAQLTSDDYNIRINARDHA